MGANGVAAIDLVKITKSGITMSLGFTSDQRFIVDLANHQLVARENLWARKRGQRAMPSRADLAVSELRPWLGNLALIDLNEMGDGTFRLCGTNLTARFGIDVTGCRVATLSDDLVATIVSFITRIRETKTPVHHRHVRIVHGTEVNFDDLALPLSSDGDHVGTLLFASYPQR